MGSPAATLFAVALCLVSLKIGLAQPLFCGGENKCLADTHAVHLAPPHASWMREATGATHCAARLVEVIGASPGERRVACSAADAALQALGRCGIVAKRPLRVAIEDEVDHPHPHIGLVFGVFDPSRELVRIAQPSSIRDLVKDTPYAALPTDAFYESLIVHEIVHGVMHQHQTKPIASQSLYEYPAYAIQIESLPPAVRDTFLASVDPKDDAHDLLFNDVLLFLNPYFFAARAYRHFSAAPDRCAHLQAILEGDVTFIVSLPRL